MPNQQKRVLGAKTRYCSVRLTEREAELLYRLKIALDMKVSDLIRYLINIEASERFGKRVKEVKK